MNRTVDIQNEWRRLVDGIALNWLQDHLGATDPPRIVYDRDAESAIIISAMQHLWDEQDWPRREMTTEQWRRLADTIRRRIPG